MGHVDFLEGSRLKSAPRLLITPNFFMTLYLPNLPCSGTACLPPFLGKTHMHTTHTTIIVPCSFQRALMDTVNTQPVTCLTWSTTFCICICFNMRLEQDAHVRIMDAWGTHWHMLSHTHAQVWCWSGGVLRRTVQSILFCYWIRSWEERRQEEQRKTYPITQLFSFPAAHTHSHICSETVPLDTHIHFHPVHRCI